MRFLLLLILLPLSGYAQHDTLYVGISKTLLINQLGYTCNDLKAEATNCYLRATRDPCTYGLEADSPGTATVAIHSRRDDKLLATRTYTVLRIPNDVIPTVGGQRGGNIKADALKAQPGIILLDGNKEVNSYFTITAFTTAIIRAGKVLYSGQSTSGNFSDEVKAAFSLLLPGDKVFFSDIRCTAPDAQTRRLTSMEFTITE